MGDFFGGPESVDNVNEPWEPAQPYIVGDPGPNFNTPVPINYNWMDWANNPSGVAGGMPNRAPPMSMNDPRMTFQNVYTPVRGGPWGYGLGPGPLTTEAGIPGAPGESFVEPPDGFTPGPTNPQPGDPGHGGGGIAPGDLERALQLQRAYNLQGSMQDAFDGPMGSLEALAWAQGNPDADPVRTAAFGSPELTQILYGGL